MDLIAQCLLVLWLTFVLGLPGAASQTPGEAPTSHAPDIEAFVRAGCPHCAEAEAFLARLQQDQPTLRIVIRDVSLEPADGDAGPLLAVGIALSPGSTIAIAHSGVSN